MAACGHLLQQLVAAGVDGKEVHVDARDHYFLDGGVGKVDDAADHVTLLVIEGLLKVFADRRFTVFVFLLQFFENSHLPFLENDIAGESGQQVLLKLEHFLLW